MKKNLIFVLLLLFLVVGCKRPFVAPPPENGPIAQAVVSLYQLTLPGVTVSQGDILGKHYQPGSDSWNVITCVNLQLPNQKEQKDCNNSFQLFKLDSERWILDGKVNNQKLWIEVTL
nr:hypothetical protein [uncultured Desulfobulbus sp.]